VQNTKQTNKEELLEFMSKLDSFMDGELTLVALGGTALTLLDLKDSTRDIDLILPTNKNYLMLNDLFTRLNFQEASKNRWISNEGIIIDIHREDYIINVKLLQPSVEKSDLIKQFTNITLKTLNLYDICITKIDRGDKRDFDDIKVILKNTKISLKVLIRRFIITMDQSESDNPKYKLLEFVKFVESLGLKVDKDDKEKVRQWQRM